MEERYDLASGRGWLSVREEGARVICRAELENDRRGLYKVYLLRGERRLLLGTMMPEGRKLGLSRTFNMDELRRRQLWPPTGGAAELSYAAPKAGMGELPLPAGWSREVYPGRLLRDDLLAHSLANQPGVLKRKTEEGFQLALPYAPGRPFGMTPLFCFAQPANLAGRDYMIFSFNSRGGPVFPHKDCQMGNANGVNHSKE